MGFVQAGFLAAFGALAIPIVIHLIFRRQTKQVHLGTLRFLKIVLRENSRRRKVKRWLLLALRLACVALLALLFARPYLVAANLDGEKSRFAAILIDQSASMELKTDGTRLLDRAVIQAKEIIEKGGEELRVEVAFFDKDVHILGEGEEGSLAPDSPNYVKLTDLAAPDVSFFATSYGAAMSWARDICIRAEEPKKEIHIFTDLQRSGLDWTGTEPLPHDATVHVHDLGRALVNNLAVTSVQIPKTLIRPNASTTVSASIFNSGPFASAEIPIVLTLESGTEKRLLREKVKLEAGATTTVEFEIEKLDAGLWKGTIEIEVEDDLSYDNRRFCAVMAAPQLSVLLVDGDPHDEPILAETYYLETSLRLSQSEEADPESPYHPTTHSLGQQGTLSNLDQADLVVLANVSNLGQAEANRLGKFVEQGGGLLVFCGENVQPSDTRVFERANLSVGEILSNKETFDIPYRIQDWDEEHPILRPFNDPQYGNLRRLTFREYTEIKQHADANILATFRGGDPAILERTHGKGKIIWFTSSCDADWGNWSGSRLFLPLIHQFLGYLSGLTEGGPVRDALLESPTEVPGFIAQDGFWQVLNTNPRESETDRCTQDEFADRFQVHLDEEIITSRAAITPDVSLSSNLRDDEIWHWVVLILLGVLFFESFVANRTAA